MHAVRTLFSLLVLSGLLVPALAEEVPLHGIFEHEFRAKSVGENADDIEFRVSFTSPGGQVTVRDGFWDGGDVFRVRFMPTAEGAWSFRASSRPALEGLDGSEGSFTVKRVESENRFLRHGPLRVSDDGRYFVHADGTPFFWLADTAWNGALKSAPDDWDWYLRDRVNKKFTGIQFVTTQWRTAYTDAEGQKAYTGFEKIRIQPSFYQRIDARVDAVNRHGLLAVPVLLWVLGEPSYSPGKLPESQAVKLARYQVARYGAHHVSWFLPGDGRYFDEHVERWKRIGRQVFDREGHAPVWLHPQGMQWPFDAFLEEKWVTALGYQSGHGDDPRTLKWIYEGPPARKWNLGKARPVVNLEPPYEAHIAYQSRKPHPASSVRRATYWSLLNAPTAGVSYGAHGVWSWETLPGEPLNHKGTGIAQPWHVAMRLEGSADLEHLVDLFTSVKWWTLRPAPGLIETEFDNADPYRHASAARSAETGEAIVYLPRGGSFRLDGELVKEGSKKSWFDPRTGESRPAGPGDGGVFTAPDDRDWLLVVR